MFANIPDEMKQYPQWVLWRLEDHGGAKPTKVPYSPKFGAKAAVDRPGTWGTFEDCLARAPFLSIDVICDPEAPIWETGAHGIGFVLTEADPFGFIDLDDTKGDQEALERQQRIFSEFQSYAERSPSGTGLHIIIRGKVDRGRKRANIEVYSSLRYMTMTGNVYRDEAINECQELFTLLWHQMGGPAQIHQYGGDVPQKEEDAIIIDRALSAVNGDKFRTLLDGRWDELYPSHSEGDQAFVDIVAFYTQNREQITRIWLNSGLARDKTKRKAYRDYTINKSFDHQIPEVDVEGLRIQFENMLANEDQLTLPGIPEGANGAAEGPAAPTLAASRQDSGSPPGSNEARATDVMPGSAVGVNGKSTIIFPPGLVGEVAQYIYEAAPRPVQEIALVGAIGFVAGIVGRAFNVSGTGLNQYVLLLAPTGTGKEAINVGISKLVTAVRGGAEGGAPTINDFIGPGEVRSDAALIKWLARFPCFVSIVGEFGIRLKSMSALNANPNELGVKRMLLDLFNKSGHGNILNPMAYSDKEKNTPSIASPAFTLLGETTPERFFDALDESMIADGLIPRFLTIEYKGHRPALSERHAMAQPSFALVDMCRTLVVHVMQVMAQNGVVHVKQTAEAEAILSDFDRYCDAMINDPNSREITRHMWNRAHVKALKLAALVAVGIYPYEPEIDYDVARWATDIVVADCLNIIGRFERGEVGANASGISEARQIKDVISVISHWLRSGPSVCSSYQQPENMLKDGVILGSALYRRIVAMASFRNDRLGATNAFKRALQHLLDGDELRELPKSQMSDRYGTTARAFVIGRPSTFA